MALFSEYQEYITLNNKETKPAFEMGTPDPRNFLKKAPIHQSTIQSQPSISELITKTLSKQLAQQTDQHTINQFGVDLVSEKKKVTEHPIHSQLHALQLILTDHLDERELKKWTGVLTSIMGFIDYIEEENHMAKTHAEQVLIDMKSKLTTARHFTRNSTNPLQTKEWLKVEEVMFKLITDNYDIDDI